MNSSDNSQVLNKIENCIIDNQGVFKYIQINLRDTQTDNKKIIIRGTNKFKFHADIFDDFNNELQQKFNSRIEANAIGGGRINIDAGKKTILVYGYSQCKINLIFSLW